MSRFELLDRQIIQEESLYQTVLQATRFRFDGGRFLPEESEQLITWLLAHRNHQNGYTFHPTAHEVARGIRLFTGERPRTWIARRDGVEMETLRLLARLVPQERETRDRVTAADSERTPVHTVRKIFAEADHRLIGRCYGSVCPRGECAHASIAVLRYRIAVDIETARPYIERGLQWLRETRIEAGGWHSFPFFFTLLWLIELLNATTDTSIRMQTLDELASTRDRCRRTVGRRWRLPASVSEIRDALLHKVISVTEPPTASCATDGISYHVECDGSASVASPLHPLRIPEAAD